MGSQCERVSYNRVCSEEVTHEPEQTLEGRLGKDKEARPETSATRL